jgi:hypothetical protein
MKSFDEAAESGGPAFGLLGFVFSITAIDTPVHPGSVQRGEGSR